MRPIPLLALAALSVGITACGAKTTVTVPVATDSRIFQGAWAGTPKVTDTGAPASQVRINTVATYVSATTYTFTGTLAMDGVTYTLQGKAEASDGAQLTAQMSPVIPRILWEADVNEGTQKVGVLSSGLYLNNNGARLDVLQTRLTLKNIRYDLELNRMPQSTTP